MRFATADFHGGICDILCDGAGLHCGSDGSDLDLPLDSEAGPPCSRSLPGSGGDASALSFHCMSAPNPSLLGFRASLPPPPRSISMPSLPHDHAGDDCELGSGGSTYQPHSAGGACCEAAVAPWDLPGCMADDAAMELEPELAGLLQTFAAE